jgi:hypothetical protein
MNAAPFISRPSHVKRVGAKGHCKSASPSIKLSMNGEKCVPRGHFANAIPRREMRLEPANTAFFIAI